MVFEFFLDNIWSKPGCLPFSALSIYSLKILKQHVIPFGENSPELVPAFRRILVFALLELIGHFRLLQARM